VLHTKFGPETSRGKTSGVERSAQWKIIYVPEGVDWTVLGQGWGPAASFCDGANGHLGFIKR
jgi:hypothetical protein